MAATDKHYRDQNTLDIVFALSSIGMLVGMVLMIVQDYNREYKVEQRVFRDVEVAAAQRASLEKLPDTKEWEEAKRGLALAQQQRVAANVDKEIEALNKKTSALKEKEQALAAAKALAERQALDEVRADLREYEKTIADMKAWRGLLDKVEPQRKKIADLLPDRDTKESRFQVIKADLESRSSFYDIEVDEHGPNTELARRYRAEIDELSKKLADAKAARDGVLNEIKDAQAVIEAYEAPLQRALTRVKKLNDQFDAQMKTAKSKQWGTGDWVRTWPILDAFASPIKIHQYVINDVPIDYNFKYVTRFDRCATCHLGIAREDLSRDKLVALRGVTNDQDKKLALAREILKERAEAIKNLPDAASIPDADSLKLRTLKSTELTDARVTEFCAHPRLDLFVGPTSKHPAEKFGCTSCHAGQGSSTSFVLASHTPNTSGQQGHWQEKYGWESSHFWDFPMLPKRFIESSCLKCHHQVTDLVSSENRVEAPKVLRGYNLIKDVGCYGCHEIAGRKAGRPVGPDLRLEAYPPLEELSPGQRARIEADPDTAPGTLRKVGPSLFRLTEKTNMDFVRKWIYSPRGFRPDTKMPHYYGLSTNNKSVLPEDQKKFPVTEIYAITHYLFDASKGYLQDVEARKKDKAAVAAADVAYQRFLNEFLDARAVLTEERLKELMKTSEATDWSTLPRKQIGAKTWFAALKERLAYYDNRLPLDENKEVVKALEDELRQVNRRIKLRTTVPLLADLSVDPADPKKALKGDEKRGRQLFVERGCMACHVHDATLKPQGTPADKEHFSPAFSYDAEFGPNLSQVVAKLGTKAGDPASARVWLVQWLLDPTVHNPRSRMPNVHLSRQDATDMAAWLLAQKPMDLGAEWPVIDGADSDLVKDKPGMGDLKNLARVYLVRILAKTEMEKLLEGKQLGVEQIKELPAEEKDLAIALPKAQEGVKEEEREAKKDLIRERAERTLLTYVGKKAVGRLGCYACHDIPGFENAKPIGVALNDWGKKSHDRLAFDDIKSYVEHHFNIVDDLVGADGKPVPAVVDHGVKKLPYEKFYADLLFHKQREGFLNQKLLDPRSYDYNRIRSWDDRSRMPQFKFSKFRLPAQEKTARAFKKVLDDFLAREATLRVSDINKLIESLPDGDLKTKAETAGELGLNDDVGDNILSKVKLNAEDRKKVDDLVSQVRRERAAIRLPSDSELEGQAALQEAQARESIATFVLGLVAEPVPLQSVNQPKADRLAEVKGREIIERFNCQSCHLVRPGYFEFKSSPAARKFLETAHAGYLKSASSSYLFPAHYFWTGEDPKNGTIKAMVNWPRFKDGKANFQLLEALRYVGEDRAQHDIGTLQKLTVGEDFGVRPQDMITPPPEIFRSPDALEHYLHAQGPFGGTFADALAGYLAEKKGKKDEGEDKRDDKSARSAAPPFLIAEGEKVQPDWLYQFLLNPHPIRKMVVLQMPKFNLSAEDARTLTDYFAAVERLNNPDLGLTAPFDKIAQQDGLESEFWRERNREYVARLSRTKVVGPDGKETKETYLDRRLEELKPFFAEIRGEVAARKKVAEERAAAAEKDFAAVSKEFDPLFADAKKLEGELDSLTDQLDKAAGDKVKTKEIQAQIDALSPKVQAAKIKRDTLKHDYEAKGRVFESWKAERERLTKEEAKVKGNRLEEEWLSGQAYVTDAYRLLFHKQLCSQCHQVGDREAPSAEGGTPGPSLNLAHKRLRPGWIERWVSNPSFFLHYTPMPVNFKKGELGYEELFVGSSLDKIQAVRDVLMAYPEVSALPLNRYWVLPPALGKAPSDEKSKTGEMK